MVSNLFRFILALVVFSGYTVFSTKGLEACTGIKLIADDGAIIHGRTLEFGVTVPTSAVVVPRGYAFKGTIPDGSAGLAYVSKYAVVGAIAADNMIVLDGLNEKGLAAGTFYFPDYVGYTASTKENQSKSLAPVEFVNWVLTQFATLEEVKNALESVVIVPTVSKEWGTTPPPFHYVVYEKSGKALVIEPIGGKLVTYDNPLGVFTNSPTFDWHMTNLTNYINLTPWNVKPITLRGVTLRPFGQGSGMVGIPGDFTPPSRFVRAAIYSVTATPPKNAEAGVLQVFHILNQFDIPVGAARVQEDGVVYSDYTLVTCVRDPQSLKYYFKTYDDQSVKVVDLKKFNLDEKVIKKVSTAGTEKYIDISADLK